MPYFHPDPYFRPEVGGWAQAQGKLASSAALGLLSSLRFALQGNAAKDF